MHWIHWIIHDIVDFTDIYVSISINNIEVHKMCDTSIICQMSFWRNVRLPQFDSVPKSGTGKSKYTKKMKSGWYSLR